jgi:hypothetical protein
VSRKGQSIEKRRRAEEKRRKKAAKLQAKKLKQ